MGGRWGGSEMGGRWGGSEMGEKSGCTQHFFAFTLFKSNAFFENMLEAIFNPYYLIASNYRRIWICKINFRQCWASFL